MFRLILKRLRHFRSEDRGAVLLIFVFVVVPLLLLVAVATDLSQVLVVKRQLTSGVDAAALTIGSLPDLDDTEGTDINAETNADAKARAYVLAHYPEKIGTLKSVEATRTGRSVNVTATAEVATTFLRFAGYEKLTITVASRAAGKGKLEVVMVLDNTGSMRCSHHDKCKIEALKEAANSLVGILMGPETSESVKIGLVPFAAAVNVGNTPQPWWVADPPPGWGGCVKARSNGYDVTDEPPDASNPDKADTLFSALWPNAACTSKAIQPLTDDKDTITLRISQMSADGNTVIPEGLAWGWRVISPGEPFTEGALYTQPSTTKAIILMTDGENHPGKNSAYGDTDKATLDEKVGTLCGKIKDENIEIYTVAFGIPQPEVKTMLEKCVSKNGKFYDSETTEQLKSAFQSIALDLNKLRLTK